MRAFQRTPKVITKCENWMVKQARNWMQINKGTVRIICMTTMSNTSSKTVTLISRKKCWFRRVLQRIRTNCSRMTMATRIESRSNRLSLPRHGQMSMITCCKMKINRDRSTSLIRRMITRWSLPMGATRLHHHLSHFLQTSMTTCSKWKRRSRQPTRQR